jgi:hypothetical protein
MTETELKLIAKAAIIGDNKSIVCRLKFQAL